MRLETLVVNAVTFMVWGAGMIFLLFVDWRIAVGVFLVQWGNNLGQELLKRG